VKEAFGKARGAYSCRKIDTEHPLRWMERCHESLQGVVLVTLTASSPNLSRK
jgi:hypothetical protein